MALKNDCFFKTRGWIPACLAILVILLLPSSPAMAAEATRDAFQNILTDSLEAMWAGREFSPELKQRQQTLKRMLTNGDVTGGELENMTAKAFGTIMKRQETSRYVLKDLPDRFEALFAPHMNWNTAREIMWRILTAPINKDTPVRIKVGTLAPPGTPWLSVPENIAIPEIERLSDGKISIKIYGGGVMGEDTDILKKMDNGRLECCGCTALGVLEACPEASVMLLPGLFKNYDEVDYILEKFRKRFDEGFEKQGYVLWAVIDTGFFYLFSRNKPTDLAALRAQNIITWFGIIEKTLLEELGIAPIPLGVPEIIAALNTGQADVNVAPAAWMLGMQAYQYTFFYLDQPLVYSPAVVIVSTQTFERIQQQTGISAVFARNMIEVLSSEWNAVEPEWKRQIRVFEQRSFKAFETKCGMKSITFAIADQQAVKKASQAVQQKLADRIFPKDLLDDIQNALAEFRAGQ